MTNIDELTDDNRSFFWPAIVIGFLLVSISMDLLDFGLNQRRDDVAFAAGIGILLWAFGGRAFVDHPMFVMGGSAAIAVIILFSIWNKSDGDYAILQIDGVSEESNLSVHGYSEFYSKYIDSNTFEFIAMDKHLAPTQKISITLAMPNEADIVFMCIDKTRLTQNIGRPDPVFWTIDENSFSLTDSETRKITAVGECADHKRTSPRSWIPKLISEAFADDSPDGSVLEELKKLNSDSPHERMRSRNALPSYGLEAVAPLIEELIEADDNPRLQASILIVLIDLAWNVPANDTEAFSTIPPEDLEEVFKFAIHENRLIRLYVLELLSIILNEDVLSVTDKERIATVAASIFASADSDAKREGLLSVIRHLSIGDFSSDIRKRIASTLGIVRDSQQLEPETKSEIDALIKVAEGGEPKYWVIVGSYLDRQNAVGHAKQINKESAELAAFVGKKRPGNEFYPVIVGDYVNSQQADQLVAEALDLDSVTEAFLSSYAGRR